MKKVMVSLAVLVMFIFSVGCLDYKAYEVPSEEANEDVELVNEIADIEADLEATEDSNELTGAEVVGESVIEEGTVVEEDIVISDLEESVTSNGEMYEVNVNENELVKLNVLVTDPDNDIVTHEFTLPVDNIGEWQTHYGDAGEYIVTITATDGELTTEEKVKILVGRVNVPPVIEAGSIYDITVDEGETVYLEPVVSDPNGDAVTIEISNPLSEGVWETDHESAGEYQITVTASDGELVTEEVITLVVNDVNVLPEIINIDDLQDIVVNEGEVVEIMPEIVDIDQDNLDITISEPVGDDGVWQTTYTDHGEYVVTVTINDGKDIVVHEIDVTVLDVNMPPVIIDVSLDEDQ